LVFGKRAAERATHCNYQSADFSGITQIEVNHENENLFLETKNRIASLMSKKVGIVRSGDKVNEALAELTSIKNQLPEKINEYNILKIKHITDICTLICESAIIRKESRGGHIREDFPTEDPSLCAHLIQEIDHKYTFQEIRN